MRAAGFRVEEHFFFPMGSPGGEPWWKRVPKWLPLVRRLLRTRLLGNKQQIVAVRDDASRGSAPAA